MTHLFGQIEIDDDGNAKVRLDFDPAEKMPEQLCLCFALFALRQMSNLAGREEASFIAMDCSLPCSVLAARRRSASAESIAQSRMKRSFTFGAVLRDAAPPRFDLGVHGFGFFAKRVGEAARSAVSELRLTMARVPENSPRLEGMLDVVAANVGQAHDNGMVKMTNHASLATTAVRAARDAVGDRKTDEPEQNGSPSLTNAKSTKQAQDSPPKPRKSQPTSSESTSKASLVGFESFAQGVAREIAKAILAGECPWTSVIGLGRASKEQRLVAMMMETFALDRALRSVDDIPEDCKKAFVSGFLHELERQLSRGGYQLHEYYNGMKKQVGRWREAFAEGTTEETARMRMTLEMAKSLSVDAGLGESTALSLYLTNTTFFYMQALRAVSKVDIQATPARSSSSGCLIPIVAGVGGLLALLYASATPIWA